MAKRLKNWLFGKSADQDKESEAIAQLKKRLNKYEIESRNLLTKSEEEKNLARRMVAEGNKSGARQALKRANLYQQKYNKTQNLMLNLHTQVETISSAKDTVETVKALKSGSEIVETSIGEINKIDADRVMIELEEQRDRLNVVNEALSDISGIDMELEDDYADNIESQLEALEMEVESKKHGELPEAGTKTVDWEAGEEKKEEKGKGDLENELESLKKELEGK